MKRIICALSIALLASGNASLQAQTTQSAKDIVVAFYTLGFVERQPVKAAKKYISGEKYIQHNPQAADGRQTFIDGFAAYIESSGYQCELKRAIAENDLVVIHSHCKENADDRGSAIVDIFRVENNLIVEHWDVEQAVPASAANSNSMF